MYLIYRSQHLLSKLFQDAFRQCTDRVEQVCKASISCEILNDRNTPFWAVPECLVYSDVLLSFTQLLPAVNPLLEDLAHVTIG